MQSYAAIVAVTEGFVRIFLQSLPSALTASTWLLGTEELRGVYLWHPFWRHERTSFNGGQTSIRQFLNEFELRFHGDGLFLVLQSIPRAYFDDADMIRG